ncbi:hypothetical protein ACFC26_43220 [Kitasatospora purpeofusca]|uniref:hypothetical protein n=1 Tax=Kitasatospora purpeofusca TaxID=67352 RepID=UPI0035E21EA5
MTDLTALAAGMRLAAADLEAQRPETIEMLEDGVLLDPYVLTDYASTIAEVTRYRAATR